MCLFAVLSGHSVTLARRHAYARASARGTYIGFRRGVGAVLQERLHHRRVPALGGIVQTCLPVFLEITRAVSGGATAARAVSACDDALPRGAPCKPYTHKHKHPAAYSRMGTLPCHASETLMHAHPALSDAQTVSGINPCTPHMRIHATFKSAIWLVNVSCLTLTEFLASMSAPTFKRSSTAARCPPWLAQCRAVLPRATAPTSALKPTSSSTRSSRPSLAAISSARSPPVPTERGARASAHACTRTENNWRPRGGGVPAVAALASAPAWRRRLAFSNSPNCTCVMSGVSWV
jgi:hypothetical protein